jgi:hypothetical protein
MGLISEEFNSFKSSIRSKRFERLKRLERFEPTLSSPGLLAQGAVDLTAESGFKTGGSV